MSRRIDLEDLLGEASSFVHAIHLAVHGIADGKTQCALLVLTDQVQHRLNQARNIIDDLPMEDADAAD